MQGILNNKEILDLFKEIITETGGIFNLKNNELVITFPNENYIKEFVNKTKFYFTAYSTEYYFKVYENYSHGNKNNDNPSFFRIIIKQFIIVNECIIIKDDFIEHIKTNISNSDTRLKLIDAFDALDTYCDYYVDCSTVSTKANAFRTLFNKLNNLRNETCKITGCCTFKDSEMAILTNMLMSLLTCFPSFTGNVELIGEEFIHQNGSEEVKLSNDFISTSLMVSLSMLGFVSDDLIRDNVMLVSVTKDEHKTITKMCYIKNINKTIIYSPIDRIGGTAESISSALNSVLDNNKIQKPINNVILTSVTKEEPKEEPNKEHKKSFRWSYENALKYHRSHKFISIGPNKNVNLLMSGAPRIWSKDKTVIYSLTHRIAGTPELISSELKNEGLDNNKIQEIINNAISMDNYQTTKKDEYLKEINDLKDLKEKIIGTKHTTDNLNISETKAETTSLKDETNPINGINDNSSELSNKELTRIFDIGLDTIRKQFIEKL